MVIDWQCNAMPVICQFNAMPSYYYTYAQLTSHSTKTYSPKCFLCSKYCKKKKKEYLLLRLLIKMLLLQLVTDLTWLKPDNPSDCQI